MDAHRGVCRVRYEILHGDFLDDQFRSRILDANIIFVNNFAFGTEVNQKLKEIFQYCHEGCRIVSSLNFAPMGFTITDRTMGDIGCILSLRKVTCLSEGVSWTARPFDYYVHTIDHTMVSFDGATNLNPVAYPRVLTVGFLDA